MTQNNNKTCSKEKKIANSGLRLLEILKALSKGPMSSYELLEILEEKDQKIYRKELITKYLNTLKVIGLQVSKTKGKYFLEKNIEKISFNKSELSLIKFIEKYTKNLNLEYLSENISIILNILEKSFSQDTLELISQSNIREYRLKKNLSLKNQEVKKYENYCRESLKIDLIYKTDGNEKTEYYKLEPLQVMYKNGQPVLIAYDCQNSTYKEFVLKFIKEAHQTPQKNARNYVGPVTFKLKNRLAKSYVLKQNEKIINSGKNFIIVSNQKEDTQLLIRRLSRYFDQCEILYPQELRQNMLDYISEIENLYG